MRAVSAPARPPVLPASPPSHPGSEVLTSVPEHGLLCKEKAPQLWPLGRWGGGVAPSVQPYVFLFDQRSPKPGISPLRELGVVGGQKDHLRSWSPKWSSPLSLPSLQAVLSDETWVGNFSETGIGEVCGAASEL